jgi:hypothetical protein
MGFGFIQKRGYHQMILKLLLSSHMVQQSTSGVMPMSQRGSLQKAMQFMVTIIGGMGKATENVATSTPAKNRLMISPNIYD